MSFSRAVLLVAAATALSISGCQCGAPPVKIVDPCKEIKGNQPGHPEVCSESSECSDHYACSAVKDREGLQCCLFADRRCTTEADCCPGQTCPADRKKCFDRYLDCETDQDCGDKGDQFCEAWTDGYGTSRRCRYKACSALGECPSGQSCFKGECMAGLPCGGKCDPGTACVPSAYVDRCQEYACPASCAPGFIATFKSNRDIWDSCNLAQQGCECAELPGLQSGDLGRFSSLAADVAGQELVASHYDGQYGDLVVSRFDLSGQETRRQYVDGVPSGTPSYGPSGARGGVTEPGDDVGRHSDVVVGPSATYVAYYDATRGDLKLAWQGSATGSWTRVTVDGQHGDLGLYASVAVDSEGLPAISYFQRGGASTFNAADCPAGTVTGPLSNVTALKLARAKKPQPESASDFDLLTLACMTRPADACAACGSGTVCADPGTGNPSCMPVSAACTTPCDSNSQVCVTSGGAAVCADKYNPSQLAEVPNGVGLFSSLAFNGKDAYVAYMRRAVDVASGLSTGKLYGMKIPGNAQARGTAILLDSSGDTGFFPDVKVDPASKDVLVSYHDFSSRALKLYRGAGFVAGVSKEIIDSGAGPAGSGQSAWVGTDSALVFTTSGALYCVYQDATAGDLKVSRRTGTKWEALTPLRTDGAVGFFADGVAFDGKLFASHAHLRAASVGGAAVLDNRLRVEVLDAP
ncbi:MAG: hypothetical protein RL653_2137 [Pseudomonadota bacterium]